MPLEDLTGNKYIDDLVETWPLGSDKPDAGDDHLRGIKNVLKKTFPGLTGPVTLTQDELNRGSIPAGAKMVFLNAAAPAGWKRDATITQTFALRVVASTDAGGGSTGVHDPEVCDLVASHTHAVTGATGGNNSDHTHSGSTSWNGDHTHISGYNNGNIPTGAQGGNAAYAGSAQMPTGTAGGHSHTLSTGGASAAHTHNFNVATAVNTDAANWTPRYLDMIVCEKL